MSSRVRNLLQAPLCPLFVAFLIPSCQDDAGKETSQNEEAKSAEPTVESLAAERDRLDASVFADETAAQEHEQVFVDLWDQLRKEEPFAVLKRFPFDELSIGSPTPTPQASDWGVDGIRPAILGEPFKPMSSAEFGEMLDRFQTQGWRVAQTEWHHSYFRPAKGDKPAGSTVSFAIHAYFKDKTRPLVIRGKLEVEWKAGEKPVPARIVTKDVEMVARRGTPMFSTALVVDPKESGSRRYPRTSPVIVHDLNGDGLSEIIAAGSNQVLWNRGGFKFEQRDFLAEPIIPPAEGGILADFTGDGLVDYIGGNATTGALLLYEGGEGGTFLAAPKVCFEQKLVNLHALTAGDIDKDGDLDLFLGQWKRPYAEGAMPTPYYDANDGNPDFLLMNEGGGRFVDGTDKAGLAPLRNRRTFSCSFVDLDQDADLDLVVVADFSGLDLYHNDGQGNFINVTAEKVDERHSFGMSHTFGDWNGDGLLDLYMVGMSSTTARRLDDLGLGRKGYEKYSAMRAPMTFGNRVLNGDGQGGLKQSPLAASAARTGWAWGCTSTDFDLDGDEDLYVANGHLSGESAKDYCTRFWCHDLYTGTSKPDPLLNDFFSKELGLKLGRQMSWNGFEKNVLYLNQPEVGFYNAGFLLGVGFEFDSRGVLSEDLDADGRPDLLVVEYSTKTMSQRLHVLRNQYESSNHWIGLRLSNPPKGEFLHGAVVEARSGDRIWVETVVTGDSFTSQHSATAHFGLGTIDRVESLTIRWPSGRKMVLENPEVDRYHVIPSP